MTTTPKYDAKNQEDKSKLITASRPTKEELKQTTKKIMNQYRDVINNLAKR
jgi:hypothetical protein